MYKPVDVLDESNKLTSFFSPKVIGTVNDHFIKVVNIKGDKVPWHYHNNSDELFYILEGELKMEIGYELEFILSAGEFFIVKKNMEHKVSSVDKCKLLLIEHIGTSHTGNVESGITKSIDEQVDGF